MNFLKNIFPDNNTRFIRSLKPILQKVASFEDAYSKLPDSDFPLKTKEFKQRFLNGETLDQILPEAYALVREASKRTLSQRHYDVQIIGGIVLHRGMIAEMRTGEGKTLVATLPAYLNALTGLGVHVVTVNDYLSKRDASWMGQIYSFLGLSVGVINSQNISYVYDKTHTEKDAERDAEGSFKVEYDFLKPSTRKESYDADITYGTNNEFGFDYLRDNLAGNKEQIMQRAHSYAIVDEIDSILIDEARTPLIIAGEAGDSESLYVTFSDIAKKLVLNEDYTVDEKLRAISLSDKGISKAESLLGIDNIYTEKGIKYVHHLETAVKAQALFIKDKDYVVKDGEIIIVDAFTGRLQPGRRWNEGTHQAVEAKEGVKIQKETRAIASVTFQNYFKFYSKLSGMTGTAKTSEEEFQKVYNLDVISIPTHFPIKRIDHNDFIFQNEKGKYKAIARKVKEIHVKGQPVLIGTVSIENNELLSAYLSQEGIPHTILNAKNHEKEGEIIAQAGKKGSVVVATNMAGRGIDISLGGKPSTKEQYEEVKNLGGLYVLGTERHEARRIDNQLRGRAGRQGDPGETQFFVSLDDDLMRIFGGDRIRSVMKTLGVSEDEPIQNKMISRSLENAQTKIEGFHFDSRKYTLEYDNVLNFQRNVIYTRRRAMLTKTPGQVAEYVNEIFKDDVDLLLALTEKANTIGPEPFWETVRRIILHVTDILWTEHIETMDYMRQSVNLRAYGQREPLLEYKKEGLRLFKEMEINFKNQVVELIHSIKSSLETNTGADVPTERVLVESHQEISLFEQERANIKKIGQETSNPKTNEYKNVGRNDPCPCGSGKKFKHCHGK
jgi:preprotein translocase subunit SecA